MERDPLSSELFHVNDYERSGVPRRSYVFVAEEQILQKLRASPLRGRTWVCQERLLAPRQISFGPDQVFWNCSALAACELFPRGFVSPNIRLSFSELDSENDVSQSINSLYHHVNMKFRSPGSGLDIVGLVPSSFDEKIPFGNKQDQLYLTWDNVVAGYMKCCLTREEDKLPALKGLIRTVQPYMQSKT